ncbi:MAG: hypothetical protein CL829_01225 [Crocinitomicaceae bacterium]|nr:hypothetical protein [Crocinitomicaceae bacterium]
MPRLAAFLFLTLWVILLIAPASPCSLENLEWKAEMESNEQETEGEEWQLEWDESMLEDLPLGIGVHVPAFAWQRQEEGALNRLVDGALLDPPEQHS